MNQNTKKATAIIVSCLIIILAYYGSYLPFKKSQLFISTMRNLGSSSSLADFKNKISVPLDATSPIGQEELVRQVASLISNFVSQTKDQPEVVSELTTYIENYYKPIIDRGRGMSFGQNLYLLGSINEIAFLKTGDKKYLDSSKKYYLSALENGPKRPQALFGMLDIYRFEGDVIGVQKISTQILTQWPDETKAKQAVDDFLSNISEKK